MIEEDKEFILICSMKKQNNLKNEKQFYKS